MAVAIFFTVWMVAPVEKFVMMDIRLIHLAVCVWKIKFSKPLKGLSDVVIFVPFQLNEITTPFGFFYRISRDCHGVSRLAMTKKRESSSRGGGHSADVVISWRQGNISEIATAFYASQWRGNIKALAMTDEWGGATATPRKNPTPNPFFCAKQGHFMRNSPSYR